MLPDVGPRPAPAEPSSQAAAAAAPGSGPARCSEFAAEADRGEEQYGQTTSVHVCFLKGQGTVDSVHATSSPRTRKLRGILPRTGSVHEASNSSCLPSPARSGRLRMARWPPRPASTRAAPSPTRKILIAGGGYNTAFIRYMAQLTGKPRPKLLYLPTASADRRAA